MATRIIEGPFNRVEGDLEIALEVEAGHVRRAEVNSPLFRGFEIILRGKDPRDALTITPRICGICSVSQSAAAAAALAEAQGIRPTDQGLIATALIHGVENLVDHLTHFYLFFMPDFTRPDYAGRDWHRAVAARFAPGGPAAADWLAARAEVLHVMGILAGKWPHTLAIQPGGVTRAPDASARLRLIALARRVAAWAADRLFGAPPGDFAALAGRAALDRWTTGDAGTFLALAADCGLWRIGAGHGLYLSFGAYPQPGGGHAFACGLRSAGAGAGAPAPLDPDLIAEDTAHVWDAGGPAPRHPYEGETLPDADRPAGYSWCKAPRLAGRAPEVGAFARQVVDGHPLALALAAEDGGSQAPAGGGSAAARIVGRLLEVARLLPLIAGWAEALDPGASFLRAGPSLRTGRGAGLVEAARGALGHWLVVEDGRIARYQIVAPTTWNFSPRDASGLPGPLERALEGVPQGVAVQHVVRSFDPCMVCTVH